MTDQQDALAVSKKDSRIQPWGDRQDIRELSARIKLMAPGAQKLGDNEALALAQGAVAHGLDPFNGEIWYIPKSGLMAGVKGLRKAARNQIEGTFWTEFERINNPDEMKELNIPANALAFKCILRDTETLTAYSDSFAKLNEKNVPTATILDILGSRPFTVGIGYYIPGEPTRMTPPQVAMKRAESDALKRRFDLPFAVAVQGEGSYDGEWEMVEKGDDQAEVVEGETRELFEQPPLPKDQPVEGITVEQWTDEGGLPGRRIEYDINGNMWDEEKIVAVQEAWIDAKIMPPDSHTNRIANLLKHSPFGPSAPVKDIVLWGKYYRAARDEDKKTPEAAKIASRKFEQGDAPF